jgi:hypothetical protein
MPVDAKTNPLHCSGRAQMLDALREIYQILVESADVAHARFVGDLLTMYYGDRQGFVELVQSGHVWGPAGSVWEAGGLRGEEHRYFRAMLKLADEMERERIATSRSRDIAAILRSWTNA